MYTHHIYPIFSSQLHRHNISTKFIYFIFDIRVDVIGFEMRKDVIDELTWDREASLERNDVEWNV